MCLEIGDKVAVLDEAISGVVVAVEGDNVFFKSIDGMKYCYYCSDLVKIKIDQDELLNKIPVNVKSFKDKLAVKPKKSFFKFYIPYFYGSIVTARYKYSFRKPQ